jgi:hypothetical protein
MVDEVRDVLAQATRSKASPGVRLFALKVLTLDHERPLPPQWSAHANIVRPTRTTD